MKFDTWMRSIGLSESSVNKYYGAIEGALSVWGIEAGIIEKNILLITNYRIFELKANDIRQLEIYQERNNTGHNMYNSALNKYSNYLTEEAISNIEEDLEEIITLSQATETEKLQLVNARIGQGKYREELIEFWKQCAVTGIKEVSLLLASHIKPWSRSTNEERLDKYNGLLLSPSLDRAFDKGFISFDGSGKIIISPQFIEHETLGIKNSMSIELREEHKIYLEYHREHIYKIT